MAGRTIVLDSSVINQINRGNAGAATTLQNMCKSDTVYIAQQSYKAIVQDEFPRTGTANRMMLEQYGIRIAPQGDMAAHDAVLKNNPPRGGLDPTDDIYVAAQTKAVNGQLFTLDKKAINGGAYKVLGVGVADESVTVPAQGGQQDYRVGWKLMGLTPPDISFDGRVRGGATTGEPWGGPGGTPGLNDPSATLDVAGAHMIIRNGLTKISMQDAGNEAMQAYLDKKPEIARLQSQYPGFGVNLNFYFQYQPGVNADFNDTYRFEELTVTSEATGYQGIITDTLPRGQLQIFSGYLPPLDPSKKPLAPAAGPSESWYQRYLLVRKAYETGMPPYTECYQILNGSNMYDILRVLDALAADKLFNLFQNMLPNVAGVGTERLSAAFGAVAATFGSSSFDAYKSQYGKEFSGLFPDQQKDIQDFILIKSVRKNLVGKWLVTVSKWTWTYEFFDGKYVRWTDPFNGMTGLGNWNVTPERVTVSWAPKSKTTEEWNLPIDPAGEGGKCSMEEGTYPLKAVKK